MLVHNNLHHRHQGQRYIREIGNAASCYNLEMGAGFFLSVAKSNLFVFLSYFKCADIFTHKALNSPVQLNASLAGLKSVVCCILKQTGRVDGRCDAFQNAFSFPFDLVNTGLALMGQLQWQWYCNGIAMVCHILKQTGRVFGRCTAMLCYSPH